MPDVFYKERNISYAMLWDAEGRCAGTSSKAWVALAHMIFSRKQHKGLMQAASQLPPGEPLAFLGDLCFLTLTPARARPTRDTVVVAVERHCGIAPKEGETRIFVSGHVHARATRHLAIGQGRLERRMPTCLTTSRAMPSLMTQRCGRTDASGQRWRTLKKCVASPSCPPL